MAKKETTNQPSYSAKDIQVLTGLEPVRKRPGMYIGSTGIEGLHHLIWEIFDNSLDEAMAGYARNITVSLLPNNRVSVSDDGRGIPTDIHPKTKKSALETAATTLHAGGKFGGDSYKVSGGLHGVGLSVVNALSLWMRAEIKRAPYIYAQEYKQGKPTSDVKKIGKTAETGTAITFEPDPEIFKEIAFDWKTILTHLRQQAYLTKGAKIIVNDQRNPVPAVEDKGPESQDHTTSLTHTFYFEGGIVSYINFLNRREEPVNDTVFYVSKEQEGISVEVAMQYANDIQGHELSFANNVHTIEGGMHLTGFRSAITRTLNDYARKNGFLKEKDDNLSGEDVREGLTVVVSVKLRNPQFEGQTKSKLGTTEARTVVEAIVNSEFSDWLERFPNDAKNILGKVILASRARLAAKAARENIIRKGALEGFTLPGKLSDCSSKNPEDSELFIVEGESAGGSSKQGRNRRTQAILPLKGKILNVEKARIDRMLASEEIRALIIAMGTAIAEEFDISKLRYHKIVIMTDADVDGEHIRTLLLTLFYRYFPELIQAGNIYIAQPPLYKIQKGNQINYAYGEDEKIKLIEQFANQSAEKAKEKEMKQKKNSKKSGEWEVSAVGENNEAQEENIVGETVSDGGEIKIAGISIQRYKGLGEMNPEQLWETTMDPERRVLLQVAMKDAEEADKIFDILMGSEVMPRRKFIQTHAKNVKNLDI